MIKSGSLAAVAVSLALVAAFATEAGAAAGCGSKQAFARFGDGAQYTLLLGGDIEKPGGWDADGSPTVVEGNEPFFLAGRGDRRSLRLEDGDGATFRAVCTAKLKPRVRFVARASGGDGSLRVDVRYVNRTGAHTVTVATLEAGAYGSWAPTPALEFLDATKPLAQQVRGQVRVTLHATGSAAWQVDDLFIDPYLRR